jgi:hypothetical protein
MRKSLLTAIFVVALLVLAGAAVGFVVLRNGNSTPPQQTPGPSFGALTPAEESSQSAQELAAADFDSDGLINSEEGRWGSNPDNPDSDGDGYLDGEEIAADHDPTVPAPNDLLAGTQTAPPSSTTGAGAALEPGQYFADGLDFTSEGRNFTEEYQAEYGEAQRSPATMSEYAQRQPVIDRLPQPSDDTVPDEGQANTAAALANYLAVADNDAALTNRTVYIQAQYDLVTNGDPSTMQSLAIIEQVYRSNLIEAAVPAAALPVHQLLLGYSEALGATFGQIALYNEDPVKAMVATRQLATLDQKYYPLIRAEFTRLRALQAASASP